MLHFFVSFVAMKWTINWDALGISASIACAIHCAILPLFLASLPLFGINIIDNMAFEMGMILLAFLIGSYALLQGYRKHHKNKIPIILFTIGILFLLFKQIFLQWHLWLLIPAVTLIVGAHLLNYKYFRDAGKCAMDNCKQEELVN
jgi:hypothetical protein